jgi:tryptophan synthase beta chain
VRDLQRVIGDEARAQCLELLGRLPDAVVACVGGGSNAIGAFAGFLDDPGVALFGVEAAGHGVETDKHAATLTKGRVGVLHGSKSYVLCDDDGQIVEPHSISAGLDYPGVGPQHAALMASGRATYLSATDAEALAAVRTVARSEGILIALETAHAFAALPKVIDALGGRDRAIVVTVSGRGDKDLQTILSHEEAS